jgi:hypothetical protein
MSYGARTAAGLALMLAGVGGLVYGLYRVIDIGTCASGGPYVSAHPCPSNTGLFVALIVGGVFVFLIGGAVFAARGRMATDPGLPASESATDDPVPWSQYPTNRP